MKTLMGATLLLIGLMSGCSGIPVTRSSESGEWFDLSTSQCKEKYSFHLVGEMDGYFERVVTCTKVDVPPVATVHDLMKVK